MKKLQLNKKAIAKLDNPEKIYGGEAYTYENTQPMNKSACESVCFGCALAPLALHSYIYCGIKAL